MADPERTASRPPADAVAAPPAPGRDAHRAIDERVRDAGQTWRQVLAAAARQPAPRRGDPAVEPAMSAWREAVDPSRTGSFATRLARDGLTADTARIALGAPRPSPPEDPPWWPDHRLVVAAMAHDPVSAASDDDAWLAAMEGLLPAGTAHAIPFAHALWPIVAAAWDRLAARGSRADSAAVAPGARDDLCAGLLARLSTVCAATLSEVMDRDLPYGRRLLARMGPVPGDPPRTRYAAHCRRLVTGGFRGVLAEFPVLGGLVATAVRQWDASVRELLRRLHADRTALAAAFGIAESAPLTGATTGAGDTHNDGRSVCVLRLDGRQVVYKPRDIRLERVYEEVTRVVAGAGCDVRAPRTLPRSDAGGAYGWVEHIAYRPCSSAAELTRFYRNAGRTLAVLHALAATDCHTENLVAHGDHLVLIDAETLFEPPAPARGPAGHGDRVDPAVTAPATVLRVGMLPAWLWLDGQRVAVDITALGIDPGGAERQPTTGWRSVNDDAMCWGPVDRPSPRAHSLPVADGSPNPLVGHVEDLVAGFEEAYDVIADCAGRLRALLASASHLNRRTVIRPTYVYALLLAQSLAPGALVSPAARGLALERLTRAYLADEAVSQWPILAAEQDALSRLDVPYFWSPLSGGELHWTATGGADHDHPSAIRGWTDATVLDDVARHLASMCDDDRGRQASLIRAAVTASGIRMSRTGRGPRREPPPEPGAKGAAAQGPTHGTEDAGVAADTHATGRAAMAAVADAALPVAGGVVWIGATVLPDGDHVNVQAIGPGLYDGLAGLAVALHRWARREPPDEGAATARLLADRATDRLLDALADPPAVRFLLTTGGPGMAGAGGMLRTIEHLRAIGATSTRSADRAAWSVVSALTPEYLARDRMLDHMGGAAGLVRPLARLLIRDGDAHVRSLLQAAVDILIERQDPATGGWPTLPARAPLTGLAHGAAGIGLALAEAAAAIGDERCLAAAVRGIDYEDAAFDPVERNWPDLRETVQEGGFMMGWCAGAPGIALGRARLLDLLPGHESAPAWHAAMIDGAERTAAAPLSSVDHVCCGTLGLVAVLRTLARRGDVTRGQRAAWLAAADRLATGATTRRGEPLPRSVLGPTRTGLPLPGLMTGLPGAALVLLEDDPTPWVTDLLL